MNPEPTITEPDPFDDDMTTLDEVVAVSPATRVLVSREVAEACALDGTVKTFSDAEVGDDAYTWELEGGDWGEYKFETVDPAETGVLGYMDDGEVVIRKRWRLVEVTRIDPEARS